MTFARKQAEYLERREQQRETARRILCTPSRSLHVGSYTGATTGAVAKECMVQHRGYEDAVKGLGYCMKCRRSCRPQFCHADMGKGTGIKTDCRRGWPGCAECHYLVGTSGQYPKEQRRAIEAELAERTRHAVIAAGTWPKGLPKEGWA